MYRNVWRHRRNEFLELETINAFSQKGHSIQRVYKHNYDIWDELLVTALAKIRNLPTEIHRTLWEDASNEIPGAAAPNNQRVNVSRDLRKIIEGRVLFIVTERDQEFRRHIFYDYDEEKVALWTFLLLKKGALRQLRTVPVNANI
jgi:hypothetical protein